MALLPPRLEGRWADRLTRSGYFFVALLFHLVLLMMIATCIIWPAKPGDKPMEKVNLVVDQVTPTPPHTESVIPPVPTNSSAPTDSTTSLGAISSVNGTTAIDVSKIIDDGLIGHPLPAPLKPHVSVDPTSTISLERVKRILKTEEIWKYDRTSDKTMPKAQFVVYIAAYADGDWNCNTATGPDGTITAGGIPNLAEKVQQWSHGNTQATVVPMPLQIGSPDLLTKMPPFVFFTGHKDFKLTDHEVKNLQAYLDAGGAIWGDNALAGEGSRFDVAFRREMRRVIPDKDKEFTPLDLDHDLFKGGKFQMEAVPAGINYYAEAIEHIDLDGKLAILYTPNDYSDLMFMRILPGDKAVDTDFRVTAEHPLYTNFGMMVGSHTFYRNFELQSSLAVDHLGMDIITHLLTRFNDVLQFEH
jgi:hypothetical protein